jgi:argonaute-like protein implicated in RNA metabolism and viral defense
MNKKGTFMWAVEQLQQGKKVWREGGFPESKGYYLVDDNGILKLRRKSDNKLTSLSVASIGYDWELEPNQTLYDKLQHNVNWKAHPSITVKRHIKDSLNDFLQEISKQLGLKNLELKGSDLKYAGMSDVKRIPEIWDLAKQKFGEEFIK